MSMDIEKVAEIAENFHKAILQMQMDLHPLGSWKEDAWHTEKMKEKYSAMTMACMDFIFEVGKVRSEVRARAGLIKRSPEAAPVDGVSRCTMCGKECDDIQVIDDVTRVCPKCLEENFVKCDICGEYWDDTIEVRKKKGKMVCEHCWGEV